MPLTQTETHLQFACDITAAPQPADIHHAMFSGSAQLPVGHFYHSISGSLGVRCQQLLTYRSVRRDSIDVLGTLMVQRSGPAAALAARASACFGLGTKGASALNWPLIVSASALS